MKLTLGIFLILSLHTTLCAQNSLVQMPSDSLKATCFADGLFESDELFEVCLSGNTRELLRNRRDDASYHPIILTYKLSNGEQDSLKIRAKTRGRFRRLRENCKIPPLLLQLDSLQCQNDKLFVGQKKIKLVSPCVNDKYVVREYLLYRIFNLVTENSFRARLIKLCFRDTIKNKVSDLQYAIFLEHQSNMANRIVARMYKRQHVTPKKILRTEYLKMTVFQYLIANTDWSIQFLQNMKLISTDIKPGLVAVPYDFDHAGMVYAPYANPAEELQLSSVRERRYRGYCIEDMQVFQETFDLFNRLKPEIYALYENNIHLEASYIKQTLKYMDEFYQIINNPKKAANAFQYPCNPRGTGNIVIKGLKK